MKYKLGELIESVDIRNRDEIYTEKDLMGISINKEVIPTKAKTNGLNLNTYKVLKHNQFAYCTVTSRNGNKISVAYNDKDDCIISSINPVFKIKDESILLPRYLEMFFKRSEFDRYSRFNSWGTARETFSYEDFCDIPLDIPPLDIQRKYVDVYTSLLDNLHLYENGLSDLKLVCDGYIEKLRREYQSEEIGGYIDQYNLKNVNGKIKFESGISTRKEMIVPKAKSSDIEGQKVWKKNTFCFATNTARNADSLSIALNLEDDAVVSNTYCTFDVKSKILSPKYLMIYFSRKEFDRYVRFNSWGSVREMFWFEDMSHVSIPIPPISIQNDIVEIYSSIEERKHFIDKLKEEISSICPVLVKGAIDEMRRRDE